MFPQGFLFQLLKKQVAKEKAFTCGFIVALAFGLFGPTWVESARLIFDQIISSEAKGLLGSDIEIGGRRILDQSEIASAEKVFTQQGLKIQSSSEVIGIYSMAAKTGQASGFGRLIELKAIDGLYPSYGDFSFNDTNRQISKNQVGKFPLAPSPGKIWAQIDLKALMRIDIGDKVTLGGNEFVVENFLVRDSTQSVQFTSVAPRIYLNRSDLNNTKLLGFGATIQYSRHWTFSNPESTLIKKSFTELQKTLTSPEIKVTTPENTSTRLKRLIHITTDYLGLISLTALILGIVTSLYLYSSYLGKQQEVIAVYQMIGLTPLQVFSIMAWQFMFMGMAASFIAFMMTFLGNWVTFALLAQKIPMIKTALAQFSWQNLTKTQITSALSWPLLLGPLTPLVFMPALKQLLSRVGPNQLFQETNEQSVLQIDRLILTMLPALALLFLTAFGLSHSFKTTGVFFILIFTIFLLAVALYSLLLYPLKNLDIFSKSWVPSNLAWRLAISGIKFYKRSNFLLFASILLTSSLFIAIPSLKNSVIDEIGQKNSQGEIPSFFLFDIQDDQYLDFQKFIADQKASLLSIDPMVRAKITKINGQPFIKLADSAKTREEEENIRVRNRGANLTFRDKLNKTEQIVEGEEFDQNQAGADNKMAQLSVEIRHAKALQLEIGDIVEFDIFGVPLLAKVKNFRKVKWSSFLPNFFFLLNQGYLEDAPKTFLAAMGPYPENLRPPFLDNLVTSFPNISAIDVDLVSRRILAIVDDVAQVMTMMSYYILGLGLLLVTVITWQRIKTKHQELELFSHLGAGSKLMQRSAYLEMAPLLLMAIIFGLFFGIGLSAIIGPLVFDSDPNIIWKGPIIQSIALAFLLHLVLKLLIKKMR